MKVCRDFFLVFYRDFHVGLDWHEDRCLWHYLSHVLCMDADDGVVAGGRGQGAIAPFLPKF